MNNTILQILKLFLDLFFHGKYLFLNLALHRAFYEGIIQFFSEKSQKKLPFLVLFFAMINLFAAQLFPGVVCATFVPPPSRADLLIQFFNNLFFHPGDKNLTIYVLSAILIGAIAGTAYLIKKVYQKYYPVEV